MTHYRNDQGGSPLGTKIWGFAFVVLSLLLPAAGSAAKKDSARVLKEQENSALSIALEFRKRDRNPLERAITFLFDYGPNGYATGFLVGDGLVMTAYHVVSGELDSLKKVALGFRADDELEVKAYVNGCRAKVIKVDKDADLALLEICGSRPARPPSFQADPSKDEMLLLIARPHGDKITRRGIFYGSYIFRGQEFWSVKIDVRDGFSGPLFITRKLSWWEYSAATTGRKSLP